VLEQIPQYQALSDAEKRKVVNRLLKVYAAHRHPERGRAIGREVDKIIAELKKRPEPAKA